MAVSVKLEVDNNGSITTHNFSAAAILKIRQAATEEGITPLAYIRGAIQAALQNRDENPTTLREAFEDVQDTSQVIESEQVHGGIRPTRLRVTDRLDRVLDLVIEYQYPANSPKWSAVKTRQIIENGE